MTDISTAAAACVDTAESEILNLDPDVVALLAEIDDMLCEATQPARVAPPSPATGCALARRHCGGPAGGVAGRSRDLPTRPVRAVQRSPPTTKPTLQKDDHERSERQVMASQQT
ncbi:hypothetical protein [Mycobacterium parmense]|uniref:Uncharacterized protein n=1 Tax=Mycobacterium parmense TaxID=185642 RepID=A0A7I7YU47_9MYCO|nr:hypothetical protein [Mycobacterium parmense]MCV7351146.1 hypothetical protein [Mycobacterium parmense]ORW60699.1 hypothetical protein AWC20_06980 [Mycobacterium parmense]BBZ45406.1 hypothetical protein MPRM_26870 [Mycobacterium parmense]